jgi:hypothetical protein
MKTSRVSSRDEFKTSGGLEFAVITVAVGVIVGGEFKVVDGFEFVEATATVGVSVDGMSRSHAARNDAARMHKDVFKKSRREKSFFI